MPALVEQMHRLPALFQAGLLLHQLQGFRVAGFEPQVHPAAAGLLHQPGQLGSDAGDTRKAAPCHVPAGDPPAELSQIADIQGEVVVRDPQACRSQEPRICSISAKTASRFRRRNRLPKIGREQKSQLNGQPSVVMMEVVLLPSSSSPRLLVGRVVEVAAVRQAETTPGPFPGWCTVGLSTCKPFCRRYKPAYARQRQLGPVPWERPGRIGPGRTGESSGPPRRETRHQMTPLYCSG